MNTSSNVEIDYIATTTINKTTYTKSLINYLIYDDFITHVYNG